ncbi:MAG: poly-gamma-glutamate synthase PgsB [Polyangiaceae bacterium]
MSGTTLLIVITAVLVLAGAFELLAHRRKLRRIRIRVHVNGTRGKSSVTRLIASALRESGLVTCAKTTGTLARFILPDGRELPIFRPSGANIIEQKRIVAAAAAQGAEALVLECMALAPELIALCELELVRATHGVITNARPDHLDVMGPGEADVARALCGMVPVKGKMFTAEQKQIAVIESAARDRGSALVAIDDDAIAAVTPEELEGFSYTEHPDNVALALAVCDDLGIARDVALRGMHKTPPDPGALTSFELAFFGRQIVFVNGFAANDPVSTQQLWNLAISRHGELKARIAVFNCRADRPDRSLQLGADVASWQPADKIVLMGTGTYLFARAAIRAGVDAGSFVFAEDVDVEELFEQIVSLVDSSALVMGMGNIGGDGLPLTRYFRNRSVPTS